MKKFRKNFTVYLLIFAIILGVAYFYKGGDSDQVKKVKYSTFANDLKNEKFSEVNITNTKMTGLLKTKVNGKKQYVYTYAPYITEIDHLEKERQTQG